MTRQKVEHMVDGLCSEFGDEFSRREIEELVEDSAQRLAETAKIADFLPLLASRFAHERLVAIRRARAKESAGTWDLVFVSLSGGGRGQIAAAITAMLSGERVSVHSAGTAVRTSSDPGVRTVIAELGLNPDREFARPVTDEVLRGADVIVTMGHSVGVIELPQNVRHEDWRVGDPIGAPVDEVRRVRRDIEYRVRGLLNELGVPARDAAAPA